MMAYVKSGNKSDEVKSSGNCRRREVSGQNQGKGVSQAGCQVGYVGVCDSKRLALHYACARANAGMHAK